MDTALFEKLKNELKDGKDSVLCSIVSGSGSSPRGAGAMMLVSDDGIVAGTVGGGNVEFQAIQRAKEALKDGKCALEKYILRKNEAMDLGMVCGGDVEIMFTPMKAGSRNLSETVFEILKSEEQTWLILSLDGGFSIYSKGKGVVGDAVPDGVISSLSGKSKLDDGYFSTVLHETGTVYVFGGGHVASALVPVLSYLGFECAVVEDRDEFLAPERFSFKARTIKADLSHVLDYITLTYDDYACIMTRGHSLDYEVERDVLKTDIHYIGAIGSRKKTAFVNGKLLDDGYTEEDLKRIHAPIGIAIGAETEREIAISIAAELIMSRKEKNGGR